MSYLSLANSKYLVIVVNDRNIGFAGTDEADSFIVGSQFHSPLCRHSVRRVKHGGSWDRAEYRQVIERHLGNPAVRAGDVDVSAGDGGHAHLVEGPREAAGKAAHKRNGSFPKAAPNSDTHEILLGEEAFNEALWECPLEVTMIVMMVIKSERQVFSVAGFCLLECELVTCKVSCSMPWL